MSDKNMKITDKRMFTPEGDLREEYRHLEEGAAQSAAESAAGAAAEEPRAPAPEAPEPPAPARSESPPAAGDAPPEPPRGAPGGPAREVRFEDLVGLLAEHAAISLGDAALPDGRSMLDLRVAQMHIDLLDVLREKTAGNLTEAQAALLEDVLYRLRLVYVEKSREPG